MVNVAGVLFEFRSGRDRECYVHVDGRNWSWVLFRRRNGYGSDRWTALVIGPERTATLNCAVVYPDIIEKDPLFDLDPHDQVRLLEAMAGLILRGVWPEPTVEVRRCTQDGLTTRLG